MKTHLLLIANVLFFSTISFAQSFTGSWKAQKELKRGIASVELSIANPVNDILYPAYLKIDYQRFKGTYEVLLVKKDTQTLAIGRDKISVKESPFSLGDMLIGINGYLNKNGNSLDLQPIPFAVQRFIYAPENANKALVEEIKSLIYQEKLHFVKTSEAFDSKIPIQKITNPASSDFYFGIYRPIITQNGMISARIYTQQKTSTQDSSSLMVNNELIFDKQPAHRASLSGQIDLKPGINNIVFFADNFGKSTPNASILKIYTEKKSYEYSLGNISNRWGTFVVVQLDLKTTAEEIPFANGKDKYSLEAQKRSNKLLGSIQVRNPEVKLEVWDAQKEDKDSISIGLNNQWVQNGLEVKNKPKTLNLNLKKGKNTLLFMAHNLGLIPPNTAYIKLKFDKQERILEINTNLEKNNSIELFIGD